MAKNTSKHLRSAIIYCIYVRNHTVEGTFEAILTDLQRIKDLGTDIIWFLPIHPIGEVKKIGSLGSPYAIQNYKEVNPEFGTLATFKTLIDAIHRFGMKVMMDVVYNHTAHDAIYTESHPEFYYQKDGQFGNRVAAWADIIDLDYNNKSLWNEQIDALLMWTQLGVDGFRCDVAPIIPMDFWRAARQEIEKLNPELILIAETVHPSFIEEVRNLGYYMASDSETYEVFDICYDYDTHGELLNYFRGGATLEKVMDKKRAQETIYPDNYVKLRYLENHDMPRSADLIKNPELHKMWTAYMFFEKGATLLYAGQEAGDAHLPSLFEKDPVNWTGLKDGFAQFVTHLGNIKRDPIFSLGRYKIHKLPAEGVIYISYVLGNEKIIGIFNMGLKTGNINLEVYDWPGIIWQDIPDGNYTNLVDGEVVRIENNQMALAQQPWMIKIK